MVRPPLLYGITDAQLLRGPALKEKVAAALAGGCGWVQYRDKSADKQRRLREARLLLDLCNSYGASLIINDDVPLALEVGAAGVHLGQQDTSLPEARRLLGRNAIVGITCHASLALARSAANAGADYVAFGRFFHSGTKPDAPPAPLALLTEARQELDIPVVAIGGINPDNAAQVAAAGADVLAVCGSLFDCDDPAARAHEFAARVGRNLPISFKTTESAKDP